MLARFSLRNLSTLQSLRLSLCFDLGDDQPDLIIDLWAILTNMIRSLPNHSILNTLVIDGAFPQTLLSRGWMQSPVIDALRRPLHNAAYHISHLLGSRRALAITLKPRSPNTVYTEPEQKRIASLLGTLDFDGVLLF